MPTFEVEIQNATGKSSRKKVKAPSAEHVRRVLSNKYPTIKSIKKSGLDFNLDFSKIGERFTKVKIKDKAVFSRQFAAMVNAGVGIVRCLDVLSEECSNPKLKKALLAINADVQQGTNLSYAMSKHPECFDELYISMVEAGEEGGVLDEVLNRVATLLEDMARLQGQIKSAMAYPTTVGLFAVVIFFAMTIFLIPIFASIFKDLGVELPVLTQVMLLISATLRSWKIIFPIGFVFAAVLGLRRYYKTKTGRLQIDRFLLKMPLLGQLNEKNAVARFCRIFGTLTRSGVPILNCLDIVRNTTGNKVIANAVEASKQEIQQGGMVSLALQREKVFPVLAIQMISIGEETGELDGMMVKVADFYEDEVKQAVQALTSLIEPIMMVGVAAMVGVILLSMYLPMFKIFDQLG
ncbi:MAG: pilus assembly protein PilC [Cyanobacteria bacterium QH_9_48_43]|jgi:type IV pilus assembly protein PilC|nr:MAG: pilus assembly protein PilC [Cyanobacteria bacterium QS_5_48_63]PSO87378.1 MAG: pilus assembly protein PilC [Cyanobacteria bacterium QH_9_48_43]PSO88304.1 MAG: pilus assembly protein PilC [Cyanobacteria bacterium QS_3_48_167]PSP06122.1 MAG: pilus assembly protein PilC [Cyanobacteria bacterium SW_12_48_29]PSP12697.1 MAG: pilus assembly protein PilC [Cyanobacteria bacterium SW_10_48_33]